MSTVMLKNKKGKINSIINRRGRRVIKEKIDLKSIVNDPDNTSYGPFEGEESINFLRNIIGEGK